MNEFMIWCRRDRCGYVLFRLPSGHGYTGLVNKAGRWSEGEGPELLPDESRVLAAEAERLAVRVVFDLGRTP